VTTEELTAAAQPIIDELGVQVTLFNQEGRAYATRYLEHLLRGTRRPNTPAGMHKDVGHAIRDMVMDEVTALRLHGPSRVIGGSRSRS
jgi:hypothetical protein